MRDGDLWDDGSLPDLTSGLMWTATGLVGAAALLLPGSTHDHLVVLLPLAGFAVAWGLFSLYLAMRGNTMPLANRALVTAAMMPVIAVSLWATGGADSYLQPAMIFTALFISYFFPPRLAWPLMALFVGAYATPLVYDANAVEAAYPARVLLFALAVGGQTLAMQFLKGKLVRAEGHQRAMAERDPLTGVANRRGFDHTLERLAASGEGYALILIDLDDFKAVNDEHGHPAGDKVLQSVALAAARVARKGDCVARIGGDEFALIAPGAGPAGVMRLLRDLREAIVPSATFASALAGEGETPEKLVARADARLLELKRNAKRAPQAPAR